MSKALRKSAIKSSGSSIPTETRTKESAIPIFSRSSRRKLKWLVVAGRVTKVSTPPKLGAQMGKVRRLMKRSVSSTDVFSSKESMPPNPRKNSLANP